MKFFRLVLDEAHTIRRSQTKIYEVIRLFLLDALEALTKRRRLAVTFKLCIVGA